MEKWRAPRPEPGGSQKLSLMMWDERKGSRECVASKIRKKSENCGVLITKWKKKCFKGEVK